MKHFLRHIALFYDHTVPHTTGNYVRAAAAKLGIQADVYHPTQINRLSAGSHGLYLCIDDASHYLFPHALKPSALWIIDTHTSYHADRIMAKYFDFVFAAHKVGVQRLNDDGIPAQWLPLACDPDAHGPPRRHLGELQAKKYEVAFIGSDGWGRRRRLINLLRKRFPNSYLGRASHTEIGRIYSQSKIVFNCGIARDLNMRVFEALCSGTCLVTNADVVGLTDLFTPGTHLLSYSKETEVVPLIEKYLNRAAEREAIAQAGRSEALSKHAYHHRVTQILNMIENKAVVPNSIAAASISDQLTLDVMDKIYKLKWIAAQAWR